MDNRSGRKYGKKCYRITVGYNSHVCRSLRCLTLGGRTVATSYSTRAAENCKKCYRITVGYNSHVILCVITLDLIGISILLCKAVQAQTETSRKPYYLAPSNESCYDYFQWTT